MIEKMMVVVTGRVYGVNKTLRIRTEFQGKVGDHPFDTEMPELDAHQAAAVEALKWSGLENFDVIGYVERTATDIDFVVKEIK